MSQANRVIVTMRAFDFFFHYLQNPIAFPRPPKIPSVQVEPTNLCTLKCRMCPHTFSKYPKGFMDKRLFFKIVDQLVAGTFVKMFLFGEPLLHPNLPEMLKYAFDRQVIVNLETNGQLLNEETARKIIPLTPFMGVSVDATDAETYGKIRVGGDFNRLVENLKTFARVKAELSQTPFPIWGVMGIVPEGEDRETYLERLKEFWIQIAPQVKAISHTSYEGASWIDSQGNIVKDKIEGSRRTPCLTGLLGLVVRWDGKISYCCGDYETEGVLGDAWTDDFNVIWNSPLLLQIHTEIKNGDYSNLPICLKCGSEGRK